MLLQRVIEVVLLLVCSGGSRGGRLGQLPRAPSLRGHQREESKN